MTNETEKGINALTKQKDEAVNMKDTQAIRRKHAKSLFDESVNHVSVLESDVRQLETIILEKTARKAESKTDKQQKVFEAELSKLESQKAEKLSKLDSAKASMDDLKQAYETERDLFFEYAEKADELSEKVGHAKIGLQAEQERLRTKAYETCLRTTDSDIFRSTCYSLSDRQLVELNESLNEGIKKITPKVTLLSKFWLSGEMPIRQYESLSDVFPSIKGIGFVKTNEKGKAVHVNPYAVKQTEPDNTIQILKLLQSSNLNKQYKDSLIPAMSAYMQASALMLESVTKSDEEKVKAVQNYEDCKIRLDRIASEISSRTDKMTKAKSIAGKLLEIAEEDLNERIKKIDSVIREKRSRTAHIQSVIIGRQKNEHIGQVKVSCEELGIQNDISLVGNEVPRNEVIPISEPEKAEPEKQAEPKINPKAGEKAVTFNA